MGFEESDNDHRNALQKKHEEHVQHAQQRHSGEEPKTFEPSPPTPITERVSNMISEKMGGSTTDNNAERDLAPRQENDSSLASEAKSTLSSAAENARETVQEIS